MRPWKRRPRYPISLLIFQKVSRIPKNKWATNPKNSPHFRNIPKSTLNFHKSIPYPFKFLANIPIFLKTLPGPQYWVWQTHMEKPVQEQQERMLTIVIGLKKLLKREKQSMWNNRDRTEKLLKREKQSMWNNRDRTEKLLKREKQSMWNNRDRTEIY